MWSGSLGTIKATEHDRFTNRRTGTETREVKRKEVSRMLKEGIIEPSQAEWASPVVVIQKPDGSLRFCVEYRRLHSVAVRDAYLILLMDECIDSLGEAEVFSKLDCKNGYFSCLLTPPIRVRRRSPSIRGFIGLTE